MNIVLTALLFHSVHPREQLTVYPHASSCPPHALSGICILIVCVAAVHVVWETLLKRCICKWPAWWEAAEWRLPVASNWDFLVWLPQRGCDPETWHRARVCLPVCRGLFRERKRVIKEEETPLAPSHLLLMNNFVWDKNALHKLISMWMWAYYACKCLLQGAVFMMNLLWTHTVYSKYITLLM